MKNLHSVCLFLLLPVMSLLISGCLRQSPPPDVVIGISKALPDEYYGNYARWLRMADSNIRCVDLYHMPIDSALALLKTCSGLVLSGGPDIYPGLYGQEGDTIYCDPPDHFRDSLEWRLTEKALAMGMPLLGICRGLQLLNVYHGGSLYPDLPATFDSTVKHRCPDIHACAHDVQVLKRSGLFRTAGVNRGHVNSNHHQGIDRLGDGLLVVARSRDGLPEAIEYEAAAEKPFFMAVQWHPERMDPGNPLSLPVAMYFVQEAKLYRMNKE
jgi:putative glutamine amidotransferase